MTVTVNATVPSSPAGTFAIVQLSLPSAFLPREALSPVNSLNAVPAGTTSVTVTVAGELSVFL